MGIHFERGQALFALRRYAEAIVEYEQELGVNPQSVAAHANIAASLVNLGRKHQAREAARRALEIAPDYGHAHYVMSYIEPTAALAERAIREAIRVEPCARHFCRLGELMRQGGRHPDCLDAVEQALTLDARHKDSLVMRARALDSLGDPDAAAEILRSALSIDPEDPEVHQALGSIALASGDPVEALDALREARRISPIRHHDRDKILDAYARRAWPFRKINALVRRYKRFSPVRRWALQASLMTALLALVLATNPTPERISPVATSLFVLIFNVIFFLPTASNYSALVVRIAARRELGLSWRKALGANLSVLATMFVLHLFVTNFSIILSFSTGFTYFVFAMLLNIGGFVAVGRTLRHPAIAVLPILVCGVIGIAAFGGIAAQNNFNGEALKLWASSWPCPGQAPYCCGGLNAAPPPD